MESLVEVEEHIREIAFIMSLGADNKAEAEGKSIKHLAELISGTGNCLYKQLPSVHDRFPSLASFSNHLFKYLERQINYLERLNLWNYKEEITKGDYIDKLQEASDDIWSYVGGDWRILTNEVREDISSIWSQYRIKPSSPYVNKILYYMMLVYAIVEIKAEDNLLWIRQKWL